MLVSPWAPGANVFGWTSDEATSFQLLDRYVAAGGNFIDTADVYSVWAPGHKGGMEMAPGKKGLSPAYIQQGLADSLKRLQTDYIDLYQSHEDDPKTPFEDSLSTYADAIRAGKVRAIGASNYSAERLEQALEVS